MGISSEFNTCRLDYEPVDRDHEILFAFIAKLEKAMAAGAGWQGLTNLMLELDAYTDSHFENEEELMQASGYEGFAEHRAEHETMRREESKLIASIKAGDQTAAEDLVFLLKKFLVDHMAGTDRLLTTFLRQREAASPPPSVSW